MGDFGVAKARAGEADIGFSPNLECFRADDAVFQKVGQVFEIVLFLIVAEGMVGFGEASAAREQV